MKAHQEIERKFLVNRERLPKRMPKGEHFVQAYLSIRPTVRVRIVDGKRAYMTVKGEGMVSREEVEFRIPLAQARLLVELSPYKVIHKTRYRLRRGGFTWEVDFYEGDFEGLATAEVELERENAEVRLPSFVGRDVTLDPAYKNSSLAMKGLPV